MAPKLLLTGVTGYIGGDAFYALRKAHPELEYTLLVRSAERVKLVREQYPETTGIRIVYPDSSRDGSSLNDLLEDEASKADIIVHTAESADDVPSANAIVKGLKRGAANRSAENPAFWIHLCGTGLLQWYDSSHKRYGQPPLPSDKYDDVADIDKITSLPDEAYHRDVDKIVLAVNAELGGKAKTAIVSPATIYGTGRGPVNRKSMQVPDLARFTLQQGYAPVVGTGKVEWDNVYIFDVSELFVALVDAALDPARSADPEVFGPHGYFFATNATHVWGQVAAQVVAEAVRQGYLKEAVEKMVTSDEIPYKTLATNSKGIATRARKHLGWEPKGSSLSENIAEIVDVEAKHLGLKKVP
ncbi:hypothetical protein B0T26DRAFT_762858 [Lasiosphaeria miniovina]|uniref:NAD-dependent epimerase/dehydratase domain-containing protein n=1 Tax=Lasiosphaeria miniovina TaxID=1954250 RepID=A0AA40BIW1_9PEZI|nr:uncharacterized protein B0T26DRAFT_762858 [Lasiosphaeria miniovina]KAK0735045.1 hypothetical protein B0T26DRAFT_762858 [Lasiosphaeria miniovina]